MTIRLLVSVRSASEALVAVNAGADIIDVKEPNAGSLGCAGAVVINDVVAAVNQRVPVSAALGECVDWMADASAPTADVHSDSTERDLIGPLGHKLQFVKLGLAGMTTIERTAGHADWCREWQRVRQRFPSGGTDVASKTLPEDERALWIGVAYADWQRAAAPPVEHVFQAAIQTGCAGLLVDTFTKDGSSTFDWMDSATLTRLADDCREHGLTFALAGQITQDSIRRILSVRPDILAVRGAVCESGQRRNAIVAERVQNLKDVLTSAGVAH